MLCVQWVWGQEEVWGGPGDRRQVFYEDVAVKMGRGRQA